MSSVSSPELPAIGGAMKRISTKYSFAIRLFPFVFFGFLGFMAVLLLRNGALQGAPMFLVVLGVMGAAGVLFSRSTLRNFVDDVYDCGDYLLVEKRGEQDTVLFSNITSVDLSVNRDRTGARITLRLEAPGKFGEQITFAPAPQVFGGPSPEKLVHDLADRASRARNPRLP